MADLGNIKNIADMAERSIPAIKKLTDLITKYGTLSNLAGEGTEFFVSKMQELHAVLKKVNLTALTTIGVFKGLKSSFSDLTKLAGFFGKGLLALTNTGFGFIDKFVGSMIDGFKTLMQEVDRYYLAILGSIQNMRDQFGALTQSVGSAALDMARGASILGKNAYRYNDVLDAITEAVSGTGAAFRKLLNELSPSQRRAFGNTLAVLTKGLGLTGEQLDGLARTAISTGQPIQALSQDFMSAARAMSKQSGLTEKDISKDMGEMMTNVDSFGDITVDMAARSVTRIRSLGIEINKLAGVVKKFDIFKDAATSVGLLNQVFDMQLDAYKLMVTQDPTERVDMLRNSLFRTGKTWEGLNRQEQVFLSEQAGLDMQTAKLAFSLNNQGKSWTDLKKKSESALSPQEKMAKTISDLGKNIAPLTKYIPSLITPLDAIAEGVKRALSWFGDPLKVLMNFRKSLDVLFNSVIDLTEIFYKNFPGITQMFSGFKTLFDPKDFKTRMEAVKEVFKKFVDGGAKDFKGLIKNIKEIFSGSRGINDIKQGGNIFITALRNVIVAGIRELTRMADEFLRKELPKLVKSIKSYLSKGMEKDDWGPIFTPIIDALKSLYEILKPTILETLKKALEGAVSLLWTATKSIWNKYSTQIIMLISARIGLGLIKELGKYFAYRTFTSLFTGFGAKMAEVFTLSFGSKYQNAMLKVVTSKGLLSKILAAFTGFGGLIASTLIGGITAGFVGWEFGKWLDEKFNLSDTIAGFFSFDSKTVAEKLSVYAEASLQTMKSEATKLNDELKKTDEARKNDTLGIMTAGYDDVEKVILSKLKGIQDRARANIQDIVAEKMEINVGKAGLEFEDTEQKMKYMRIVNKMLKERGLLFDDIAKKRKQADKGQKLIQTSFPLKHAAGEAEDFDYGTAIDKLDFIKKFKNISEKEVDAATNRFRKLEPKFEILKTEINTVLSNMSEINIAQITDLVNKFDTAFKPLAEKMSEISMELETATLSKELRNNLNATVQTFSGIFNIDLPNTEKINRFKNTMGALKEFNAEVINVYNALEPGGVKLKATAAKGKRGSIDMNLVINLELDGIALEKALQEKMNITTARFNAPVQERIGKNG